MEIHAVSRISLIRRALALALFASLVVATVKQTGADEQAAKDATILQALQRLENIDVNANPKLKAVVLRQLERVKGTPEYLALVQRFQIREGADELVRLVEKHAEQNIRVNAAEVLLKLGDKQRLKNAVAQADEKSADNAIAALGLVGSPAAIELLQPLVSQQSLTASRRNAAVAALGRNRLGELKLLAMVAAKELPEQFHFTTANALFDSADERIRLEAAKYLKLPETADAQPLPPIATLARRQGQAADGRALFLKKATCSKCHRVQNEGKEVGPDLSEIGSKLSKEALLVAILNPNVAISHNYETYSLFLEDGNVANGVLVSQTDDSVTIRTAEAVEKKFVRNEIEEMTKLKTSLMPSDLQKLISVDELVDVVEFLTTLKKKS